MPGVYRLVRHLKKCGVRVAVATSSMASHYDLKSRNHTELFELFDHVVTGDDVTLGKPDPAIFLMCMNRYSPAPQPQECLVFEDAIPGVEAGRRAGMRVVMVPDARLDLSAVDLEGVDVISSLELFDPVKYGLPPLDTYA